MKASFILATAALTFAAGTGGCSSDDATGTTPSGGTSSGETSTGETSSGGTSTAAVDCDTLKSKCPNEPELTADDRARCKELLASACGDQYKASLACTASKETCDADGMSDGEALQTACETEKDAWEACSSSVKDEEQ
jgi:hypothetical protein